MNKVAITGLSGRIERVKSFIRGLSARAEFCLVLLIGFGPLIIVFPEHSPFTAGRLAVLAVLVISIINPVFEELLETGYFIHSLQKFGMWPAVLASAAFRALFHLPFGINAMLSIFALGLIFGFVYWRWRQLWPLVVAHSLMDLLALFYGSYHGA